MWHTKLRTKAASMLPLPLPPASHVPLAPQSDEAGPADLAGLVQNLQGEGGGGVDASAATHKFEKGDRVLVVEGEPRGRGALQGSMEGSTVGLSACLLCFVARCWRCLGSC